MQLEFKNPKLKKEYEFNEKLNGLTKEQGAQVWKKNKTTESQMVLSMLCGYVSSLCEIVEEFEGQIEGNPTLDLTYGTVQNLPRYLGQQYFAYVASGSFSPKKAMEILKKTMASYLMLLCMNEHNCMYEAQRYTNFDSMLNKLDENQTDEYSWMGFVLRVGVNDKYDLLLETENAATITAKGVLRIRVSHICEIYKRMCGVDLKEKGLDDMEGVL
jgi:hypothetical protein